MKFNNHETKGINRSFMKIIPLLLCFFFFMSPDIAEAKKKKKEVKEKDPVTASTFRSLKFRNIGPAFTSGRIADIAVNPKNFNEYYVAAAAGHVWKTVNNGTTWSPIFDNYGSYSIASVVVDPNNPSIVWVGTGEYNSQRAIGYGDGVYKSTNGGRSFKNMGLKESEHIGRIRIDPRNSDVVYVAAQGPLWGPGGERGLYKTCDGGETWKKILDIDENTGITDIVLDPRNPDVFYVASYQRRRHVYTLVNGGPGTALYKTTDAGENFKKLRSGLPSGDMGRIGLAISPVNPDYVFAIIEAANGQGGFFRSTNQGETWRKMSSHVAGSPQYYNRIYCDLWDVDRIYSMETYAQVSDDGGRTWTGLGESGKHVDNHAFWIDPRDPNHYIIGCDGGVYETFDRAKHWVFKSNLPVTQFYRVAVDNDYPFYNVYGGTQDNNSFGGPSRVFRSSGAINQDWYTTNGGDGFWQAVDPTNPDIVYSESQYGGLIRYDRKSGESVGIQPQPPSGEAYRWNWNAPLLISPHSHKRIYFAANKLFRSDDYGASWKTISPDLTRQLNRDELPVFGKIQNIEAVAKSASTSLYGNIVSLDESRLVEGLIYVGTDDGLVQVTEDGGKNWRKIESFPGVPETTYVSAILADKHNPDVVYASFDNRKKSDFKPYVLKSSDRGQTWESIAANLPENGTVHALNQDFVKENILFLGTEFSFFISLDGGKKWIKHSAGLPTIPIRHIAIQERENDLILASFGRGFFILDDYTPIRNFDPEILKKDGYIFPIKEGLMYNQTRSSYGQGHTVYHAPNPAYGVTFTYFVKETAKTKLQDRKAAQAKALKEGTNPPYPTWDDLRAEQEEETPFLQFTIKDMDGNIVKVLKQRQSKGINRTNWNYSMDINSSPRLRNNQANNMAGSYYGPDAVPGKYTVSLARNVGGEITELAGPVEFSFKLYDNFTIKVADRSTVIDFMQKATSLNNAVQAASAANSDLGEKVQYIKQVLYNTPNYPKDMMEKAKKIETLVKDINIAFNGNPIISRHNDNQPPALRSRARRLAYISPNVEVPGTSLEQYEIVKKELKPIADQIEKLQPEVKALLKELKEMGAPWIPGMDIPEIK